MDALDARDQARSEFYNLICFFFDRITSFSVKNPVVCLAGNNGQYSEEEFETLLMQLHLYAFPVIKKCLSREGFIDFCQKYPPDKLGFVYKTMGEWIKSNVPALPDDFL